MGPLDCEHWSVALLCDFTSCKSICRGTNLVTSPVRHFGVSASAVYPSEHWSVALHCSALLWTPFGIGTRLASGPNLNHKHPHYGGRMTHRFNDGHFSETALNLSPNDAYQYNNKIKGCGGWENKKSNPQAQTALSMINLNKAALSVDLADNC